MKEMQMARGTDPINDPRWEGQDSLSVPNRPAHPDPSRVAESDPSGQAVHGIVGFDEAKHNLTPEAEVRANLARSDAAFREELEGERDAVKAAVDSGGGGDEMKARLKGVESSLRAQPRADAPAEDASAAQSVAEAVQSGEVVPSIEATSDGEDGKREDAAAGNAPVEKKEA
jgi:hypothetical protein